MILRDTKWGGNKTYTTYEELEKDFATEVTWGRGVAIHLPHAHAAVCLEKTLEHAERPMLFPLPQALSSGTNVDLLHHM